ncbi:MAG: exo-alpha-sialidase [Clostridiales bacterium]|nr:exo-alpha-sialidase [Clostridiales bacterium]
MKKLLTIILCLTLSFLAFGCNENQEGDTNYLTSDILMHSVQISNGLEETSADGPQLAFDEKFGIMFCIYMPGPRGSYGESRGRIRLAYYPASQPTNVKTVDVHVGDKVFGPQILSLGQGRVRVFYEINSWSSDDSEHAICYKDFNYATEEFESEGVVQVKKADGTRVKFSTAEQFAYLEENGFKKDVDFEYLYHEQANFSCCTLFEDDYYTYGTVTSYNAQPILCRSTDGFTTVEFFAVCPYKVQYEFDYRILDGKIHAVYRTEPERGSIYYISSDDMGKTWSTPILIENSVSCRPRLIIHNNKALIAVNNYKQNDDNKPDVIQGRTNIRLYIVTDVNPNNNNLVADLYSETGIVNVAIIDVLGDVYMAYGTSQTGMDYNNSVGTSDKLLRGKDAIRYVRLGDLTKYL